MWITAIAWIIIFPSEKALKLLDVSNQTEIIFYGEWIGVLDPGTTPYVNFWQHVSGYMGILFLLVFERKFLEWLDGEDLREERKHYEATIGGRNNQKNYEYLSKEVERRKKIEDKKLGRDGRRKTVGFTEVEEEAEVDHKEKLKIQIDQVYSILGKDKKKEEAKSKPLKSALKSAMKNTNKNFEEEVKLNDFNSGDADVNDPNKSNKDIGNESDDEFNILFTK